VDFRFFCEAAASDQTQISGFSVKSRRSGSTRNLAGHTHFQQLPAVTSTSTPKRKSCKSGWFYNETKITMKSTAGARNNDLSGDALLQELFNKEFNKLKARHERAAQRSIVRNTTDKEFSTALNASMASMPGNCRTGHDTRNSILHGIAASVVKSLDSGRTVCTSCGDVTTVAPNCRGNRPRCLQCRIKWGVQQLV